MIALSGCASERTVNQRLPTVSQSGKYPFGGWVIAVYEKQGFAPNDTVSGELISYQDHKLYILGFQQMNVISDSSVTEATLYMYKKQPGIFAILTILGILPNLIAAIALPEYAPQFLVLAIIPLVSGSIFTITESTTKRNLLIFPKKNTLDQFVKFSRFPQGIPPGLDINQLKLPERK